MTHGGSGGKINLNPDEVHSGANSMGQFGENMSSHQSTTSSSTSRLKSGVSSDRSGMGKVLVEGTEKVEEVATKASSEMSRLGGAMKQRLDSGMDAHVENDEHHGKVFDGIKPEEKDPKPKTDTGGPSSESSNKPNTTPKEPPKTNSETSSSSADDPAAKAEPKLSGNKPPTAKDEYSDQFKANPKMDKPSNYKEPLPEPNKYGVPSNPARGEKFEDLTKGHTITRDKDGLIDTVDGKPLNEYIKGKSSDAAKQAAKNHADTWRADAKANGVKVNGKPVGKNTTPPDSENVPKGEKVCSALAVDRRSGLVTHGVNGDQNVDIIPHKNLHPLLQQNLQDLRAYKHTVSADTVGDGRAHISTPASHAEVKAVNELLWQREAGRGKNDPPLGQNDLNELRFHPAWGSKAGKTNPLGDDAPACANCNTILHGVPSYTGRYTMDQNHPDFKSLPQPGYIEKQETP